ncbi:MAG TPA: uroporphyrinogen decarboxylase family protein [Opitutaceae bacterium]|nr:uroporphyrinogen decarboxylase family protein [Opitutaceae bacterium]
MGKIRDFVLASPHRLAMPILSFPGVKLTGVSVRELVTNPPAQVAVQRLLQQKYRTSFMLSAMDLSVEAEAFGSEIRMEDAEIPCVTNRLVTDDAQISRLEVPAVGTKRTAVYLETVRLLAAKPTGTWILGGMIGPFSLAARLYGVSEALQDTLNQPEMIHALLEKATAFLLAYAEAFKRAGARGIIIAEPTAGLISPNAVVSFSSPYIRQIVKRVADDDFEVILHNCGARLAHLPATLQSGAQIYHFGKTMDIPAALARTPADVVLCGNLDPAAIFVGCDPAGVRERTAALLQATKASRAFVVSSGCDIPPDAPLANVDAFFDAIRDFQTSIVP